MNDTPIKNYCTWARTALIEGVAQRMERYDVSEGAEAGLTAVGPLVLSPQEAAWRDDLLRLCREEGAARLRDRAAYTWFNRIAAVRYMEVHDYLPSRVRMFTRPAAAGGWELGSQAVDEARDLQIEGIDPARVAELKQAGEDEPLLRYLFLAQCDELSDCLPGVFEPVDACMALLMPANLMDGDGVIGRMVTAIDEADWADVQILGWMYQYYNIEVKDAFFASKDKETPDTIGPATQLFTPDWIVRYMVQNSLGRLWMLNNPASSLRDQMEYYIEPDAEHEDFIKIESPEDITLCDPACGSAHILVYAFELLAAMYRERGYRDRDIPELILTKNLAGMEIDPRAGQIAGLALAMCARELDRRFFKRGVRADIATLRPVSFEDGELPEGCALAKKKDLLDALAHLDEVGSLLCLDRSDLAAIREAMTLCDEGAGGLFAATAASKLERALDVCEKLARSFDCVVANPPYMGSSSFGPFLSKWVKKNYPDVKSDLFSSFVVRMFTLAKEHGECGVMSPFVWMFIGSYEKLRTEIIDNRTLTSLIQLEYSGFAGATVPICTYTFHNSLIKGYKGGYVRLSDFVGAAVQAPKALEAIQNPDCGWFYRRDAETFKQIPGTPIAYWFPRPLLNAFIEGRSIDKDSDYTGSPNITGDNDKYLRMHWEISNKGRGSKWRVYSKGGDYRRWYGNLLHVIDWSESARRFYFDNKTSTLLPERYWYQGGITYTMLTSGKACFRFIKDGCIWDKSGPVICRLGKHSNVWLAFLNSNIAQQCLDALNPTMNLQVKDVKALPLLNGCDQLEGSSLIDECISISNQDWDSSETSMDFKRHPLV